MNRTTRAVKWGVIVAALALAVTGCKKKKAFAEDCKDDFDCVSLHCSPFGNICSKDCTVDSDCGGNSLVCRADDKDFSMCSKPVGNPPNGSCMSPSDCDHGHCLHRVGEEDQPGICSAICNAPADCPVAGMKICESISDSAGAKYCLPGDATAPPSGATRPKFGPAAKPGAAVKPKTTAVVPVATIAPPPAVTAHPTASVKIAIPPPKKK